MNILSINTRDAGGGAAIAAYRLHESFKQFGHQSALMVGSSILDAPDISLVPKDWRSRWFRYLLSVTSLNYLEYIGSYKIYHTDSYRKAQLLIFHNLHRDYFCYLALSKLTQKKPSFWVLHDMWPFTGHCAFSYGCTRWKIGCGNCLYLDIYPSVKRDMTRWELKLKSFIYSRSKLTIIAPSKWMQKNASQSILGKHFEIHTIPHGIDTKIFNPLENGLCRITLGIPKNKIVLLFAAENIFDYRKGFDLLLSALRKLPRSLKRELLLLVMGSGGSKHLKNLNMEYLYFGYIESDNLKALCFSAADIFLYPSRMDNFPLVLLENLACGTPCIGFDTGGISEIIREGCTGYLAPPEDVSAFKDLIIELVENHKIRNQISLNCRKVAINEYKLEQQVKDYLSLSKKIQSDLSHNE